MIGPCAIAQSNWTGSCPSLGLQILRIFASTLKAWSQGLEVPHPAFVHLHVCMVTGWPGRCSGVSVSALTACKLLSPLFPPCVCSQKGFLCPSGILPLSGAGGGQKWEGGWQRYEVGAVLRKLFTFTSSPLYVAPSFQLLLSHLFCRCFQFPLIFGLVFCSITFSFHRSDIFILKFFIVEI